MPGLWHCQAPENLAEVVEPWMMDVKKVGLAATHSSRHLSFKLQSPTATDNVKKKKKETVT